MLLKEFVRALEATFPAGSAASFDHVGLQAGDPDAEVSGVMVALDLTHAVLDEALHRGMNVVLTHHPVLFTPLKKVRPTAGPEGLVWRAIREGVHLVAAHTNVDVHPDGVSIHLAKILGLTETRILSPIKESRLKLVTFVPPTHTDAVREALSRAGAGRIGLYEACSFTVRGMGSFRPLDGANPFTGTSTGETERAEEDRLEMEVPKWALPAVLNALRSAHPYEEVAYDVLPLQQTDPNFGYGAIGMLPEPLSREAFLTHVSRTLGIRAMRATDFHRPIQRVAVCGGSGSSFLSDALAAGADAYVTADLTYHPFFSALGVRDEPQLCLVDAGHFETEAHTVLLLAGWVQRHFPAVPHHAYTPPTYAAPMWIAPDVNPAGNPDASR